MLSCCYDNSSSLVCLNESKQQPQNYQSSSSQFFSGWSAFKYLLLGSTTRNPVTPTTNTSTWVRAYTTGCLGIFLYHWIYTQESCPSSSIKSQLSKNPILNGKIVSKYEWFEILLWGRASNLTCHYFMTADRAHNL